MRKYLVVLTLFCTSCMMGPNYKTPDIAMPSEFLESPDLDNSVADLKNWWNIFEDPVLNDLVSTAIANNLSLKTALEKVEETRANFRIKKADLFPDINLNAATQRVGNSQNLIMTSFLPVTEYNVFQVGFDAIWEVDVFGRLRREKEAAFYQLQSSQETMRDVYVTLVSDVARYYMDICAIQNIIFELEKKINFQKTIFSLAENLYDTGLDSKINQNQEYISLKRDEENLYFYNTLLKQSAFHLAVLLGMQPEKIVASISDFTKMPIAIDKIKVGLPSTLLQMRPDVRRAERNLAAATAKTGAAIAEYFPIFSLTGSSGVDSNKISDLFVKKSFQWNIGSFFNWPIITFGKMRANVDVKKSQAKQALYIYENTVLDALRDVEGALSSYYNEGKILNDIQKEIDAFTSTVELEKSKYQSGLNSLSTYYQYEKNLLDKKIEEINSKRALAQDLIAVYKALGGSSW